ncbi:DMT family transporter [Paenibacillus sp. SYP-B3998]|uniref:DMT family transporter n=1 Tax=Paenibacillus sp. SYP-B3998 TaxID=2678564 RepID=A0A6G4A1F4_9BACL|nr:DMT family transporter [Paenibacillus sp. SYP-B3998]NEW07659.1 DMT family transporter [Paenibacillus sp. SYP-B3998]
MDLRSKARNGLSSRTVGIHGIWYVALGATLWGLDPLFRILLLKSFTSAQIVFIEHLLLACYALPVLIKFRKNLTGKLTLAVLGAFLFISWGGSAIATILFTSAFAHGSANAVLLLQKLQPLFAIILARLMLKESLPSKFFMYILVALLGTYLLTFGFGSPALGLKDLGTMSCLFSILAAVLWGGSTVMGKYLLQKNIDFPVVTALRFLLAVPLLLIVLLVSGDAWHVDSHTTGLIIIGVNLMFQAFFPGLISMLLYYKGLSSTKAFFATLAELAFPAVGVLINWLVFGQELTLGQLFGFVLIWLTLWLMSRGKRETKKTSN